MAPEYGRKTLRERQPCWGRSLPGPQCCAGGRVPQHVGGLSLPANRLCYFSGQFSLFDLVSYSTYKQHVLFVVALKLWRVEPVLVILTSWLFHLSVRIFRPTYWRSPPCLMMSCLQRRRAFVLESTSASLVWWAFWSKQLRLLTWYSSHSLTTCWRNSLYSLDTA